LYSKECELIQMKKFPRELFDHVREMVLPKEQRRNSMQELLCTISTPSWKR